MARVLEYEGLYRLYDAHSPPGVSHSPDQETGETGRQQLLPLYYEFESAVYRSLA